MLKVLFFGTPQIAVPFLQWLSSHTEVVGVVCRPDEPVGRGYELTPPPTKVLAQQLGIPVFQPQGPWTEEQVAQFRDFNAHIGIIVAYGRILPRSVFTAPRLGSVNLHFSLLPKYRGAAPMQWSLIKGETRTGVTAFWLEEGLDSGPIFHQRAVDIAPADTLKELREKLIKDGIDVLGRVITDATEGNVIRRPQEGEPSLAPQLKKADGRISWKQPTRDIVNLIRGVVEWPGATTTYRPDGGAARLLKIFRASAADRHGTPGAILFSDAHGIVVGTGDGSVRLEEVQPEGKKPMNAWSFWQGAHMNVGDQLGE